MSSITELIDIVPAADGTDPEDIFACAHGLIFPDDLRNFHGDPGATIIYKSSRFGEIKLRTTDPSRENERQLFSHYLWNAGIKLAELVSKNPDWNVEGERVLELGAGVGLSGIVACLAKAKEVVISDYPAESVLTNLQCNAESAIPQSSASQWRIEGCEWGDLTSPFAQQHRHHFTRILAADCYWMSGQHENLAKSMLHFLTLDQDARVFAVAGFHTGRAKLAAFFDVAAEQGLDVENIYEEDACGVRRKWSTERGRGYEDHTERKKWLVIARLKRR